MWFSEKKMTSIEQCLITYCIESACTKIRLIFSTDAQILVTLTSRHDPASESGRRVFICAFAGFYIMCFYLKD
ncbi:hypothetical protein D3C87_25740 [compost metagenome]